MAAGAGRAQRGRWMLAARNREEHLARLTPGDGSALFSLPATPDPLVTRLAFLLFARLVLERSAQASGLSLLPRHRGRFLLAPRGIVQGLAQRSRLRRPRWGPAWAPIRSGRRTSRDWS